MSESVPLISVVIPVYNVEDYLEKCLTSVAGQSYTRLEVICVIDGSQDGSEVIAQRFAEADNRYCLITQENQGLSVARNKGVQVSRGDYIFFLDSDDWLAEKAIENLVNAALISQRPIISGAVIDFLEETGVTKAFKKAERRKLGKITLHRREFFALETMAWNKLYRRDIVLANPFTPQLIHEDLDFYWRVFSEFPDVFAIPESVVFYRRREGTLSNMKTYDDSYQDSYIRIIDNAYEVTRKHAHLQLCFQEYALKYIKHLRKRNAPAERYIAHISERFGIADKPAFRIGLKCRQLLEKISST